MNIKGQTATFETIEPATGVTTATNFQAQIDKIQANIQKCARQISMFDVYRIRYVVDDMANYNAIRNQLLPGEALAIQVSGDAVHPAGEVTVRLNELEYATLEPFQTGTYYPSAIAETGSTSPYSYIFTYAFTDTRTPAPGTVNLSSAPTTQVVQQYTATLNEPSATYYYGFVENETASFFKLITPRTNITFAKQETQPIIKCYLTANNMQTFEEIYIPYSLSLSGSTYTLLFAEAPSNCYVAIK